ncbi:MAG: transcriptional repressor [Pseudomonadales bacterium]|nr:transcriptional repressor [Pseudomonadales bacterium]
MSTKEEVTSEATALIEAKGHRATEARIAVIDTLLLAEYALSHQEIEQRLANQEYVIDRVTLYRVLDWALKQKIAHKITGDDRVWRFNAAINADHAHFHCSRCGQIYCLEQLTPAVALTLPTGFKFNHAELTVQGICPHCNE